MRLISEDILRLSYNNLTFLNSIESTNLSFDNYYDNIQNEEWTDDIIILLISKYY